MILVILNFKGLRLGLYCFLLHYFFSLFSFWICLKPLLYNNTEPSLTFPGTVSSIPPFQTGPAIHRVGTLLDVNTDWLLGYLTILLHMQMIYGVVWGWKRVKNLQWTVGYWPLLNQCAYSLGLYTVRSNFNVPSISFTLDLEYVFHVS